MATPTVVLPDGSVTVDWTVTTASPGSCALASDWIAFFAEGAGNGSYGGTNPSFVYTQGLLGGQAVFTLTGPPTGSYEFRYMRSGYVPVAVSETVVVVDAPAVPALGPWAIGAVLLVLLATGWRRLREARARRDARGPR